MKIFHSSTLERIVSFSLFIDDYAIDLNSTVWLIQDGNWAWNLKVTDIDNKTILTFQLI